MDYKERYNKLIEAIKVLQEANPSDEGIQNWVHDNVPELKESKKENKGERIRRVIIEFLQAENVLHDKINSEFTMKEAINWLEKQGGINKLSEEEQNRFAKSVLSSCAMSFIDYLDAHKYEGKMCVSNGECEDIENAFHNAMWDRLHRYYCKYMEKQGNQKSELKKIESEKLDTYKVIEWLYDQACFGWIEDVEVEKFVDKFKKDFGL